MLATIKMEGTLRRTLRHRNANLCVTLRVVPGDSNKESILHSYTKSVAGWLRDLLASNGFFWGIIVFFIFEALWLVFSAAYPLAFDEEFHFGVIQIYARDWSPFLAGQPAGADAFGALARDPSYLFHYLMSFPYRLITLLTDNQVVQVIVLRLLNVAMFTGGLILFKRVLRQAGTSAALSHTALAIFVLVPIVPYLAATINYDNFLFLLLPWLLLLAFRLVTSVRRKQVDVKTLAMFGIVSMLLALVKYAILPLLLGIVVCLAVAALRLFRGRYGHLLALAGTSFRRISMGAKALLMIAFVVTFGMFFQRYGINLISYGSPAPSCDAVLSVERCQAFGPYARDTVLTQTKDQPGADPIAYTEEWLWGMWHRSFFAVSGPGNDYATRWQLPIPSSAAIALAVISVLAVLARFRRVFRRQPLLQMLAAAILLYLAALWLTLYGYYLYTGEPVAINGRYLLPILLPLATIMGQGISLLLRRCPAVKAYAAALAILLFVYGGGVSTYIIRSEQTWLWQNGIVLEINAAARAVLSLIIIT